MPSVPVEVSPHRRLYRRADDRLVGGVASGLAGHLGVPVLAVRLAFVVLLAPGGIGAVYYAVFWAVLHVDPASAARSRHRDVGQLTAFCVLGLGLTLLLLMIGGNGELVLFWSLAVVTVGGVLLWRWAGQGRREQWAALSPQVPWLGPVLSFDRVATVGRLVGGGVLVLVGLIGFLAATGELRAVREGLLFGAVLLVGVAVAAGPWLARIVIELRDERRMRVRSQERAEIAAIVHDQVLHTLALIQRNADQPREVVRLARGQERDLRNWLYKPTASPTERLAAALEAVAAEVEDSYGVTVDVVVVGDTEVDPRLTALVHAAREGLVNAARHAGVSTVSLYAEVEPNLVSLFVRDRGVGFDLDQVDGDRHGVRGSILDRMARHGGTAEIRSRPGEGTEVRLTMQRVAP